MDILKEHGLKTTRRRSDIVNILMNAAVPMSAEQIYEKTQDMALSTVYRTLEVLCECGVVKKENILDGDKMHYELADGKHRHHAICLGCGKLEHIECCPVHSTDINGFTITGHKLELYGYCTECSENKQ